MVEKADVEFMMQEGVGSFLKQRLNSFDASQSFFEFHKKVKAFLTLAAKSITTYYILTRVYASIGPEKFMIMLLSGYVAYNYMKKRND